VETYAGFFDDKDFGSAASVTPDVRRPEFTDGLTSPIISHMLRSIVSTIPTDGRTFSNASARPLSRNVARKAAQKRRTEPQSPTSPQRWTSQRHWTLTLCQLDDNVSTRVDTVTWRWRASCALRRRARSKTSDVSRRRRQAGDGYHVNVTTIFGK